MLDLVMLDAKATGVPARTLRAVGALGVEVVDVPLMTPASGSYLDDELFARALLSLA